jgi:hypothetical protein
MVLRSRKNPVPRPEEPALTPNATEEQATDGQQTDTEREVENRRTRILQSQEKFITDIDEHMLFDQWGIIRKDGVILIPAEDVELQEEIIDRIHNRRHGGIQCTAREIGTHYIWRGMKTQVKRKVRACDTCQRARTTRVVRTTAGAALKLEDIEQVPVGSIVGIDVMTIEPVRDDRASCVITCTCLLSKWVRAKPMRTQTASEVVDALETMFRETIFPLVIVSDNAPVFHSKAVRRFAIRHGARLCYLPPYASPYAGWIERSHQTILTGLRVLNAARPTTPWEDNLPEACHLGNSRPYETGSRLCPLSLVYGNSQAPDAEDPADVTGLLEAARMLHLAPSEERSELLNDYRKRAEARRVRQLKSYEYLFNKRRREIHERLRDRERDRTGDFPPGSYVRVFRPVTSKVKLRWSEPRMVLGAPSAATRTVERPDGSESLEWVANLMACSPECSV